MATTPPASTGLTLLHQGTDCNGCFTLGDEVLPLIKALGFGVSNASLDNAAFQSAVISPSKVSEWVIICRATYALAADIISAGERIVGLENCTHRMDLVKEALFSLKRFVSMYEQFGTDDTDCCLDQFKVVAEHAVKALGWYNATVRLKICDRKVWPKIELCTHLYSSSVSLQPEPQQRPEKASVTASNFCDHQGDDARHGAVGKYLLQPQMPCDLVPDRALWSAFSQHTADEEWIGHGYAWRSRPFALEGAEIENAAGNSMNDYDMIEDGFRRLKKASILTLDYDLLCEDFPFLKGRATDSIEEWVLENTAFISAGQVKRISPGGDHHELLGIDQLPGGVSDVVILNEKVETKDEKATVVQGRYAVRIRSGGRAATFFVNDSKYKIASSSYKRPGDRTGDVSAGGGCNGPLLQAHMIDVKGVGTHIQADVKSPHTTGLLCFADALREFAMQRLIRRLFQKEGVPQHYLDTVKFYGIVDTGLKYQKMNPATGWAGDRCVLLLRQRQSRIICSYDVIAFSGNVDFPVDNVGPARVFRRIMHKYGISCEFFPLALLSQAENDCPQAVEADVILDLEEAQGNFNLQADATGSYMVDLSDFYVLPDSPLPKQWRMSNVAIMRSIALGPQKYVNWMLTKGGERALKKYLFNDGKGEKNENETIAIDPAVVKFKLDEILAEASQIQSIRDGAAQIDPKTGQVKQLKPKYCMCWFMELDDSYFAKWCQNKGMHFTAEDRITNPKKDVIREIDCWLPT